MFEKGMVVLFRHRKSNYLTRGIVLKGNHSTFSIRRDKTVEAILVKDFTGYRKTLNLDEWDVVQDVAINTNEFWERLNIREQGEVVIWT